MDLNGLVFQRARLNYHMPKDETIWEAVLGVLALAWAGFLWYLVVWLLVAEPVDRPVIQDEAQTTISQGREP